MDGAQLALRLAPFREHRRWWIAFSGGLDSSVLLDLCHHLSRDNGWPPLAAIHVNHQLNPRAAAWAEHCRTICAQRNIPLVCETVTVDRAGLGIEAAARIARYAVFDAIIGPDELLLQAHHADDQAETVLLRLLRGSAPTQLAAIPARRPLGAGELFRPLLSDTRADLEDYAQRQGLSWIEDDSNADRRFDRNYLRHCVMPKLQERWPAYQDRFAHCATQAAETQQLLEEVATDDLARCASGDVLTVSHLRGLSAPRRLNLLRHWLSQLRLPAPSRDQLEQTLALIEASTVDEPVIAWPGGEIRRFRDGLYAMPPVPPFEGWRIRPWQPLHPVESLGGGRLAVRPSVGAGLRQGLPLEIRARTSGERCQPVGRPHSQTLRRLLQEYGVPPWLRDRLPLVYSGDELVAVADLWVCDGYQAGLGEPGWVLEWIPPGPSTAGPVQGWRSRTDSQGLDPVS